METGRLLVVLGLAIAAVGVAVIAVSSLGVGRLPGDIVMRRGGFTFSFPIVTSIILSLILTVLLNLILRRH